MEILYDYCTRCSQLLTLTPPVLYSHFLMRIFLASIVIILGANLLIDLLDSDLVDVMQERRETIEKQMERM